MPTYKFTSGSKSVVFEADGRSTVFGANEMHPYTPDRDDDILYLYDSTGILKRLSNEHPGILFNGSKGRAIINTSLDSVNVDGVTTWADAGDLFDALADILVNFNQADAASNALGRDAWGIPITRKEKSILHGMFTFNVPVSKWKEVFNGVERLPTNATSVNGKLRLVSGGTLNDISILQSFRNPRYQPNRGHKYSTSMFIPNPTANGVRDFGLFTDESGVFYRVRSSGVYTVVRTTIDSVTSDTETLLDLGGADISKGFLFDIQFQWRGVGDYFFYFNLKKEGETNYLGNRTELTIFNPALPLAFRCENLGDEVALECGCVDVTSIGGDSNGKTYGSVGISNEAGQISVSEFNTPVIAIRSKTTVNGLINTRDTLALLASAYGDQRCLLRVWITRDFSAITENDQSWKDFGDGHLEYIEYDNPDVGTPMTFDPAKASPAAFGCRVNQDDTYATSALFEGRTDIYQTPGDMFVFTVHRENGGDATVGVTYEFAEDI